MPRLLGAALAAAVLSLDAAAADDGIALVQNTLRVRSRSDLDENWVTLNNLPIQSFGQTVGEAPEDAKAEPPPPPPPPAPSNPEQRAPPAAEVAEEKKENAPAPSSPEQQAPLVAEVAKDKTEPDLFEVESEVQVLDLSGGPRNGSWVNGVVAGRGRRPGTFNISFMGAKAPLVIPGIPARLLRRRQPPPSHAYEVGDTVRFLVKKDWVPGRVTKRDTGDNTYGLHVFLAPPGKQDLAGIPGAALQRFNATEYDLLETAFRERPEWRRRLDAWLANRSTEEQAEAPHPSELPHFEVGDGAQAFVREGPNKGTWIQVSITGRGKEPDSYTISTGSEERQNVPAADLRKVDDATSWDI